MPLGKTQVPTCGRPARLCGSSSLGASGMTANEAVNGGAGVEDAAVLVEDDKVGDPDLTRLGETVRERDGLVSLRRQHPPA